jgi:hypothetical protein
MLVKKKNKRKEKEGKEKRNLGSKQCLLLLLPPSNMALELPICHDWIRIIQFFVNILRIRKMNFRPLIRSLVARDGGTNERSNRGYQILIG